MKRWHVICSLGGVWLFGVGGAHAETFAECRARFIEKDVDTCHVRQGGSDTEVSCLKDFWNCGRLGLWRSPGTYYCTRPGYGQTTDLDLEVLVRDACGSGSSEPDGKSADDPEAAKDPYTDDETGMCYRRNTPPLFFADSKLPQKRVREICACIASGLRSLQPAERRTLSRNDFMFPKVDPVRLAARTLHCAKTHEELLDISMMSDPVRWIGSKDDPDATRKYSVVGCAAPGVLYISTANGWKAKPVEQSLATTIHSNPTVWTFYAYRPLPVALGQPSPDRPYEPGYEGLTEEVRLRRFIAELGPQPLPLTSIMGSLGATRPCPTRVTWP